MNAPLPLNELQRLEALHQCEVLDTPAEGAFDEITGLAAELLRAPISLVSLVDETRQWFKSRQGLDVPHTPRAISFCSFAILQEGLFEIPNALEDPRFADNPLVIGEPYMRFYAGTPLVTADGRALGTLNVIDTVPRKLSESEKRTLTVLGRQVVAQLELRRKAVELRKEVAQRQRACAAADEANLAKSQFLTRMSHEIRTPLNAILGFAQLMQIESTFQPARPAGDRVGQILRAGQLLLELVNETLDLARIEAGAIDLQPEHQPLGTLVRACVEMLSESARQARVEIHNDVELDGGPRLWVDGMRLKQILINLLSNAIKYNRPGGSVSVVDAIQDDVVRITVKDTGPGIDEANLAQLFQPFNRLGAERSGVVGTGLGLAIAKRLAELMGGKLNVTSVVGVGTTFTLELPLAGEDGVDGTERQQIDPFAGVLPTTD